MPFTPLTETEDFTFPSGAFDVRGWTVRTMADGEKVGEVDEILIDESGELRYLDVDLGLLRKHVLVPIGLARVDEREDLIWVPGMTKSQIGRVPAFEHDAGAITPEYEARLDAAYSKAFMGGVGRLEATRATLAARGRLASLGELDDYQVATGDPDPRGWEVMAADGRQIGEVHELIVDTAAMKVRYLDVDVSEEHLGLRPEGRHILLPIGYARLDEDDEMVIVDAITSAEVAGLPTYAGHPVTPEYEERLHATYPGGSGGGSREPPRHGVERFYAARRRGPGAGGAPGGEHADVRRHGSDRDGGGEADRGSGGEHRRGS